MNIDRITPTAPSTPTSIPVSEGMSHPVVRRVRTGVRSREITMTDLPVRLCRGSFPLPATANRVSALAVPVLWVIGVILTVVGAVLWIAGSVGHEVGGRRHYW